MNSQDQVKKALLENYLRQQQSPGIKIQPPAAAFEPPARVPTPQATQQSRVPTPQGSQPRVPTPQASQQRVHASQVPQQSSITFKPAFGSPHQTLYPSQLLPPSPMVLRPGTAPSPMKPPMAPSPMRAMAPSPSARAPSPMKPPLHPQSLTPNRSSQPQVPVPVENTKVVKPVKKLAAPLPRPAPETTKNEMVLVDENLENVSLEQFKEFVRKWIELDKHIKVATETLREKKRMRDKLADIIQKFMCKYNIEDLNTKEGKIRCKVRQVKAPVTQTEVKQKLQEIFSHDEKKKEEILGKIYQKERPKVEKVSLRRLKITST